MTALPCDQAIVHDERIGTFSVHMQLDCNCPVAEEFRSVVVECGCPHDNRMRFVRMITRPASTRVDVGQCMCLPKSNEGIVGSSARACLAAHTSDVYEASPSMSSWGSGHPIKQFPGILLSHHLTQTPEDRRTVRAGKH